MCMWVCASVRLCVCACVRETLLLVVAACAASCRKRWWCAATSRVSSRCRSSSQAASRCCTTSPARTFKRAICPRDTRRCSARLVRQCVRGRPAIASSECFVVTVVPVLVPPVTCADVGVKSMRRDGFGDAEIEDEVSIMRVQASWPVPCSSRLCSALRCSTCRCFALFVA
jgi:hypothetical protein